MDRPAFEPRIFEPGDPDSAVDCPPIVMLDDGPATRTDDMRLTVGVRKDGGEDLLIVMRSWGGGNGLCAADHGHRPCARRRAERLGQPARGGGIAVRLVGTRQSGRA